MLEPRDIFGQMFGSVVGPVLGVCLLLVATVGVIKYLNLHRRIIDSDDVQILVRNGGDVLVYRRRSSRRPAVIETMLNAPVGRIRVSPDADDQIVAQVFSIKLHPISWYHLNTFPLDARDEAAQEILDYWDDEDAMTRQHKRAVRTLTRKSQKTASRHRQPAGH